MSESIFHDAMYWFYGDVIAAFGKYYLREPNAEDTVRVLSINENRGFLGMQDNIDCMHLQWKNYPFG
jgi:hypothetical protein